MKIKHLPRLEAGNGSVKKPHFFLEEKGKPNTLEHLKWSEKEGRVGNNDELHKSREVVRR